MKNRVDADRMVELLEADHLRQLFEPFQVHECLHALEVLRGGDLARLLENLVDLFLDLQCLRGAVRVDQQDHHFSVLVRHVPEVVEDVVELELVQRILGQLQSLELQERNVVQPAAHDMLQKLNKYHFLHEVLLLLAGL